ncbi:hypothetical protein C7377_1183 [Balneicella halophila]|uniref:Uncharacterized protein n=1 Tax=Balneicella halophila TaxID=1537566 RepID=A0A7L4UQJ0_BALHA|nr:hypothetical protein [Balneicella halophila]PVX50862.1 hypothetical protein C7377_1183 [Balneicella halophila]
MNRRFLLALPMMLILAYIVYVLATQWQVFGIIDFIGIFFALIVAVHFVWMQLSYRFIDFKDHFKIKDVYSNVEEYQKQRRMTNYVLITILLAFIALKYFL